ncbi:hypothetical protein Aduo_013164 [Ancylostoma duodenale]
MDFSSKPPPIKEAEEEFKSTSTLSLTQSYNPFVPFKLISSYTKLVRVVALVLKFLAKLHHLASTKHRDLQANTFPTSGKVSTLTSITSDDCAVADLLILREHYREGEVQLQSRLITKLDVIYDKDGIVHVKLRMARAKLDEAAKKPILLLPAHPLTEKIVKHYTH